MDKKEVFRSIYDAYHQSVDSPINPFTVDNPDILLFNGTTLIGLFFPLSKELKNPDLLLRRLYISRLSMSKTLSSVLVLTEEESLGLLNYGQVTLAFDSVYIYENTDSLVRFLGDNIRQKNLVDPRLRRIRMRRFWGIIDYIDKYGIITEKYESLPAQESFRINSWSRPEIQRLTKQTIFSYPYLYTSKGRTKQSFMGRFEDIMTITTMFNYSLVDGILRPNPEAMDSFMFLNIEGIHEVVKNTMNFRTLAFLGYLPGSVSSVFDMPGQRDRFYSFMKEKKYL